MARPSRYSPEVRERAIRMVREHGAEQRKQRLKLFCHELEKFISDVRKASGKSLTAAEASQLLLVATQIEGEVGC